MVVDDRPENLDILVEILSAAGFRIQSAINAQLALNALQKKVPDLILLDIMMPGMNGYEMCKLLKSDPETECVPIIFISALDQTLNKVKAFEAGGVDYITKPFQSSEILARVRTHLRLSSMQRKLELQNQQLKQAAEFREDIDHIIRHDLKGPLTPILNYPRMIKRIAALDPRQESYLDKIEYNGLRMMAILNTSMNLLKMEKGYYSFQPVTIDIVQMIKRVIQELEEEMAEKTLKLAITLNGEALECDALFWIQGEWFLCQSMLMNLIRNAVEASPEGETLTISLLENGRKSVEIHNFGTIPEEIRERFFEKYTTHGKLTGSGLGTYIAKLSAETLGADINYSSSEDSGTSILIRFPDQPLSQPRATEKTPHCLKGEVV